MELKGPIYLGLFPPRKVLCLTLCLIGLSLVNKSFVWFTDVLDEHLLVAQTLTSEDIDEMRRQGAKGDEIIEALIANSATFEKKTAFSQEKYRIKKQKKYAPRVLLSICEAYFKKYPNRIGYLVLMEEDITSLSCFQDIGSPRYKMTIRSTNGPLVCVSLEVTFTTDVQFHNAH
ncbi:hypothetical protein NC652_014879 [Populus alba x Populus x berolinensis]|nr:hypothetical protein NC652_014879 [Populus alba x Populus x berolinensis]